MTLGDLYRYSNPNQHFSIHLEGDGPDTIPIYSGDLENCPMDLLEQEVNSFMATEWKYTYVELCI